MKKILILLQDIPFPPNNGIDIKAYNLLKAIAKHCECHILSFSDCDSEDQIKNLINEIPLIKSIEVVPIVKGLRMYLKKISVLTRLLPPSMGPYLDKRFLFLFRKYISNYNFDVIYYDIINLAPYINEARHIHSIHSPNDATSRSYYRAVNEEKNIFRKIYLFTCAYLLKRFEKNNYSKFDYIHTVSPVDADYLNNLNPQIKIKIIPIAVDDMFLKLIIDSVSLSSKDPRLLFSGSLSCNGILNGLIDFIDNALPKLVSEFPSIEFVIVGKDFPDIIREKAKQHPEIKIYNWVSNYLETVLSANVVVCPDKSGTGLKNRVLQAMALGRPVVGSPIALEGFDFANGIDAIQCLNSSEMAEQIIRLLKDKEFYSKVSKSARLLVEKKYSSKVVGEQWLSMINEIFLRIT